MKSILVSIIFILNVYVLFAQNKDDRSVELRFNVRTNFARVDDRYNIFFDTLYYANSGFRVYSDYDIDTTLDGTKYIIFRYPKWRFKKNRQNKKDSIPNKDIADVSAGGGLIRNVHQEYSYIYPVSKNADFYYVKKNLPEFKKASLFYAENKPLETKDDTFYYLINGASKDRNYYSFLDTMKKKLAEKKDTNSIKIEDGDSNNYNIEIYELVRKPYRVELFGLKTRKIAMRKELFDDLVLEGEVEKIYTLKWLYSTKLTSGFMTVPFKLRPSKDSVNFNMTTDITLGSYIGVKKRISRTKSYYIVLPITLGLSYINVGNNETSNVNTENNNSLVPGWTWSSGVVLEMDGFNLGFVFGQDFASGVGEDWLYNEKLWISFSIGYSFFNNKN